MMPNLIEPLAWDSKFFNRLVGRLKLKSVIDLGSMLQLAKQQGYELLYIYSPTRIRELVVSGYKLLDVGGHISFEKELTNLGHNLTGSVPELCQYKLDIPTSELLELAFLSGVSSRFKIDPLLPAGNFESLYKLWLENSLKNRPKTMICTYRSDGRDVGLITLELHDFKCSIDLLAVSQSYQGKGIASKMIRYAQEVCIRNKLSSLEVKTQLSNSPAKALYMKNSFVESECSFLYHGHCV